MENSVVITAKMRQDYKTYKMMAAAGIEQFIHATRIIRDRRLYLVEYTSFKQYCEVECEYSRRQIDRLIVQDKLNEELSPFGLKVIESHARILSQLDDPEDMRTALHLAQLEEGRDKVTDKTLRSAVKVVQDLRITQHVDTGNGTMSAIDAAIDIETNERLQRQYQHIEDSSKWSYQESIQIPVGIAQSKLISMGFDPGEIVKLTVYKRKPEEK